MEFNVHLFGITRDIVGGISTKIDLPSTQTTVGQMLDLLKTQYPSMADVASILVAVNDEYAEPNQVLQSGDEIALIPPVSGG